MTEKQRRRAEELLEHGQRACPFPDQRIAELESLLEWALDEIDGLKAVSAQQKQELARFCGE